MPDSSAEGRVSGVGRVGAGQGEGAEAVLNYASMNIALKVCAPGLVIITVTRYRLSTRYHSLHITLSIFKT